MVAAATAGREPTPAPGSDEAIDAGCRCPVLDNAHGAGYMGGVRDHETGEPLYVYNEDCPVHAGGPENGGEEAGR